MTGIDAVHLPRIRLLAARMREQAGETHIALYRRKFQGLASELEEAAVDTESRQRFVENCRQVS